MSCFRHKDQDEIDMYHHRLLQAIQFNEIDDVKHNIEKLKHFKAYHSDEYFIKALEVRSMEMIKPIFFGLEMGEFVKRQYLKETLNYEFPEALDFLISQGCTLLDNGECPWSAFIYCIEHNKLSILKYITKLPESNYPSFQLCHAAMTRNPEILSKVMEYPEIRSQVNDICTIDGKAYAPIHWCLNVHESFCKPDEEKECVKLLLDAGADINLRSGDISALYLAAMHKDAIVFCYLLENGAELFSNQQILNEVFRSFIEVYSPEEDRIIKCVQRLLEAGADVHEPDNDGRTPLFISARKHKTIFEKLLNFNLEKSYIDIKCGVFQTPVLSSILSSYSDDLVLIEKVLKTGCDINITNGELTTPLMYAVSSMNLDLVQLLLKYGADVNACDRLGKNAANICLESESENDSKLEILKRLIENGTSLENKKHSLLDSALELGAEDCLEFLIERGVDTNNINSNGGNILHVAADTRLKTKTYDLMVKSVADINQIDHCSPCGRTPLMNAAIYSNERLINVLVNNGCDLSNASEALYTMARRGLHHSVTKLLKAGAVVGQVALADIKDDYCLALLLKNGGENLIDKPCERGNLISTKLYSLYEGDETIIFTLITYNCSLEKLYIEELGNIDYFKDPENFELADILYQSGAPREELMKCICGEMKEELEHQIGQYSLKSLCRRTVRQCLRKGIQTKLDILDLPDNISDYILLKDILHEDYFTYGEINFDDNDEDEEDDKAEEEEKGDDISEEDDIEEDEEEHS